MRKDCRRFFFISTLATGGGGEGGEKKGEGTLPGRRTYGLPAIFPLRWEREERGEERGEKSFSKSALSWTFLVTSPSFLYVFLPEKGGEGEREGKREGPRKILSTQQRSIIKIYYFLFNDRGGKGGGEREKKRGGETPVPPERVLSPSHYLFPLSIPLPLTQRAREKEEKRKGRRKETFSAKQKPLQLRQYFHYLPSHYYTSTGRRGGGKKEKRRGGKGSNSVTKSSPCAWPPFSLFFRHLVGREGGGKRRGGGGLMQISLTAPGRRERRWKGFG